MSINQKLKKLIKRKNEMIARLCWYSNGRSTKNNIESIQLITETISEIEEQIFEEFEKEILTKSVRVDPVIKVR